MVFKKGNNPWNKGLTKETDERVKKYGKNGGKTKKRLYKEGKLIHPNLGKHIVHSGSFKKGHNVPDKWKEKISKKNKGNKKWLGKFHKKETKEKISKIRKKLFSEGILKPVKTCFKKGHKPWCEGLKLGPLSEAIKKKISKANKGEKNSMFGEHHSEKTKIKMSKKRVEYFQEHPEAVERFKKFRANQILPKKDTKIEVKIQNFLKQLGIEFFTHQHMKIKHGYQCDILIPAMNLVIECDGDYWHKYPIGNDIDHIRTRELIEKGFKVLRLWEFEVNEMSIKEFENRLRSLKCQIN